MKLNTFLKATYINASEREYKNPSTGQYYKSYSVSLDQDAQCGTLKCTEDAYMQLCAINRFEDVHFKLEYNDQYKTFQVVGAQLAQK